MFSETLQLYCRPSSITLAYGDNPNYITISNILEQILLLLRKLNLIHLNTDKNVKIVSNKSIKSSCVMDGFIPFEG